MAERIAHEIGPTGAALAERSARGKIVVSGADRRSYLHAMLTNDIASLVAGRGCYAAYLTPQGRMIADMRVLDLGDVLLLDVDAGVTTTLLGKLDQFVFSEDVSFGDVTAAFCSFALVGPRSAGVLAGALNRGGTAGPGEADLDRVEEYANFRTPFLGDVLIVAGSRELAAQGFDLYIDRQSAHSLRRLLLEAGANEVGPETTEVLRVERGRPAYPADMDGDTIPLEAGIEHRAISFTKGCYPGQEVIARVLHRGHGRVVRKLTGLVADGPTALSPGDTVRAGDRDVGRVTSAVISPALGHPIALAYLHRDSLAPGTAVEVVHAGVPILATVTDLPFVKD
jgi:tRNA-modifying protein YgfZ